MQAITTNKDMATTADGTSHQATTRSRTYSTRTRITRSLAASWRARQRSLLNSNSHQLSNKHLRERQRREWQRAELPHLRILTQQQSIPIQNLQNQVNQLTIEKQQLSTELQINKQQRSFIKQQFNPDQRDAYICSVLSNHELCPRVIGRSINQLQILLYASSTFLKQLKQDGEEKNC